MSAGASANGDRDGGGKGGPSCGGERKTCTVMGRQGWIVNEVCGSEGEETGSTLRGGGLPVDDEEEERCLAFFWSPDSRRLLYLTSRRGDAEMFRNLRGMALRCRWNVLDVSSGQVERWRAFTPSQTFLEDVLPNFDSYARSMSLWSPDSSAFCFAGSCFTATTPGVAEVQEGAWVQQLGHPSPVMVAEGVVHVAWSPS
jgi:hypothetical protein